MLSMATVIVLCFCHVTEYLAGHAVFATATKESSTISQQTLEDICKAVDIPVVAIGGITAGNAEATLKAGCAGIAVVSAIFAAEDASAAAKELWQTAEHVVDFR